MSHMRKLAQTGVMAAAVAALVSVSAGVGPASADPTPAGSCRTYAAVGSDTTQAVWNGLTNPAAPAIAQVSSWDAVGSDTITPKCAAGTATFARPVGSGNGAKALSAVWDPNYASHDWMGTALTHDEIDFSRSSSGPVAGSGLAYLPFARDAVSVAINPYSSTSITTFSTAQLAAIYGGPDDNVAGSGVNFNKTTGLPMLKGVVLHPKLPQAGSGTRKFFQGAIGITDADLGSYVDPNSATIENDGSYLDTNGDLVPFSAAQWIGQSNGVQADTTSGVVMTKVNNKTPFIGTAPNLKSGSLFGAVSGGKYTTVPSTGVGVFARDTYNVVPTAYFSGTTAQQALLTKLTGSSAGTLGTGKAQSVIRKFGFGVLAYYGNSDDYLSGAFQH